MKFSRGVCAALCALLFLCNQPIVAFAQDAAPAVAAATSGTAGQLLALDGKTSWPGQVVRLVDASTGELVAEVTTGEQGAFTLPALAPGAYVVAVGQLVRRFTITAERPVQQVRLLASAEQLRGEQIPLADLNQVAEDAGTSMLLIVGTTLLIGGAAVGGTIAGYNLGKTSDNQDKTYNINTNNNPVSPSQP